jgi:hypothetical protein
VFLSLALIRFIPYPFLACPNFPSIGFRYPGLTWYATAFADGRPRGLAASIIGLAFQPFSIALGAVDLICQYFCRIKAKAISVIFHLVNQVATLVESIPGDGIQKRKSVHQIHVDLGSEFGFGAGFPTVDGSDVGLIDTHYAVRYLMARCPKHLQLLVINGLDDPVALLHLMGERKHDKTVKLLFNYLGLLFSSEPILQNRLNLILSVNFLL